MANLIQTEKLKRSSNPILTARSLVQSIIKINFPIDVCGIARELGITEIKEVDNDGFVGLLATTKSKIYGIINISTSIREKSKRRFTITHELGHFLITTHGTNYQCTLDDINTFRQDKPHEYEADTFAAELLMPEDYFKKDIYPKSLSKKLLVSIAEKYGSSLTSTFIRYKELTEEKVAVILSENGLIKWGFGSNNFRLNKMRGDKLHEYSYAIDFFNGDLPPDDFETVDIDAWFDASSFRNEMEAKELSVPLPRYNQVLTMLWAYEKDHDIDEYEENELDGYLRFKKR